MKKNHLLSLILVAFHISVFADVQVGQTSPNIDGKLIDGESFSLQARKGKVVLINFWASWCEPCKEEMPLIETYLQKNKSRGVEVLAIKLDKPSGLEAAKKIMGNYSFNFALKRDMNYSGLGYIWRVPSTFVIDKKGLIKKNGLTGEAKVDARILEEIVNPLLSEE